MEDIIIQGAKDTYFTPSVNFNVEKGICELEGESYLEETVKFYDPLIKWIKDFGIIEKRPLEFNFKLIYFNTSSSRCILSILKELKSYKNRGGEVTINWYHDPEDEDMIEEVEDFMEDANIEIELIEL